MRLAVLLVVGCTGGDHESKPSIDPISVHVTAGDRPIVGVRVVFQNANSNLVHDTVTDDGGKGREHGLEI